MYSYENTIQEEKWQKRIFLHLEYKFGDKCVGPEFDSVTSQRSKRGNNVLLMSFIL